MVAVNKKKIRCVVLAISGENDGWTSRGAMVQELVPGADPYVAQLIQRLQDEVRQERRLEELERRERLMTAINPQTQTKSTESKTTKPRFSQRQLIDELEVVSDLEVPWFDMPEDESWDDEVAPEFGDRNDDATPTW
jgi:hypothetical protein